MVSMARPLLADPEFVLKAQQDRAADINTCIGCNQACLDHVFQRKVASCLVNPRACHETELNYLRTQARKRIAVVGAGPAGLACSTVLAERGHEVHLFDGADEIGGQFNMAKRIPGKEEFYETLRYFGRRIETLGVKLSLGKRVAASDLSGYDEVVIATGVSPRNPRIKGQDEGIARGQVLSYIDVLLRGKAVGKRVAVVGAGGIGFDVAEFLVHDGHSPSLDTAAWMKEWGVGDPATTRGGVVEPNPEPASRQVYLLQRKSSGVGKGLGKTTGWVHRAALKMKRVQMMPGVNYESIDEAGLVITFGEKRENLKRLEVDTIVLCAGQEPLRELVEPLTGMGIRAHLIGGADVATELDAKRAIDQGSRLAATL
jgi:2,4-dienoyl-CoA reductase (NADPH2)